MREVESEHILLTHAEHHEIAALRRQVEDLMYQRGMLIMVVRECMKSPDDARAVASAALDAMTRGYQG